MEINFNIFISHDVKDKLIAVELKSYLENIFLNLNVYVSGTDIEGGHTWIEHIKIALKSSQVIIALISKSSINSNWLYFESGTGFTEDRTIPLITDKLDFADLFPPISLLQARILNKVGMSLLIADIVKKLGLRMPSNLPRLEDLINRINAIIDSRNDSISSSKAEVISELDVSDELDPQSFEEFNLLEKRARKALIENIIFLDGIFDIPDIGELESMSFYELTTVAKAYNVPVPVLTLLILVGGTNEIPYSKVPNYRKLYFLNRIKSASLEMDNYEKSA